jgi:RNA polymerase sigma-70 factor (ECF subfamily)
MLIFCAVAFDSDGDREIFESVYIEHRDAAMRAALRKCGNNHALAEEAVQEAFLYIIRGWEKFLRIPCNERQYFIVSIVKYRAIDIMNEEAGYTSIPEDAQADPDGEAMDFLLERRYDAEFLEKCIARLPETYRTILELRYRHDLNNPEIAKLLGISENNTAVRLSRAIARLREIVLNEGGEQ